MKPESFYKFGLAIYASWQVYYSYWWMTIHKKIKK